MGRPKSDPILRFRSYCKEEGGCTVWTGGTGTFGHAIFTLDSKRRGIPAARAAWILFKGDPGKAKVIHACGNKLCVKIEHLELHDVHPGRPRNLTAYEKTRIAALVAAGKTAEEIVAETGIPGYSLQAELKRENN
jgi:hypothetical protein